MNFCLYFSFFSNLPCSALQPRGGWPSNAFRRFGRK